MAGGDMWVVPGAPLEGGKGWRIWYSRKGQDGFEPADPTVETVGGGSASATTDWALLDRLGGVGRRMGLLTLRLDNPQAATSFHVEIPETGGRFRWRTLPPADAPEVRFLVSSCFWLNADKEGHFGATVADLTTRFDPAFKLLMGDQVYQDWPPRFVPWQTMREMYANRYSEYWGNAGYQQALQSCPNFFSCDDHEFWNNFPDRQPQVPWTYAAGPRGAAADAAQELYHLYQRAANPESKRFYSFDTAGVSIFVADTRSERTPYKADPHGFFSQLQRDQLEAWFTGLQTPGVLLLPQPLFQRDGRWTDRSLSNFTDDYAFLCELFEGPLGQDDPHDVLIITGDIHTGRHATGHISGFTDPVHELVASPAARIWQPTRVKPNVAPGKLFPRGRPSWTIWVSQDDQTPTTDNHVGLVEVTQGTNERKRFTLGLWRVRPNDDRPFWERGVASRRRPPLERVLHKEIELR